MGQRPKRRSVATQTPYFSPVKRRVHCCTFLVVIGTTLVMPIANLTAVFAGDKLADKIPIKLVHGIAAAIFAGLGVATLLGAGAEYGL